VTAPSPRWPGTLESRNARGWFLLSSVRPLARSQSRPPSARPSSASQSGETPSVITERGHCTMRLLDVPGGELFPTGAYVCRRTEKIHPRCRRRAAHNGEFIDASAVLSRDGSSAGFSAGCDSRVATRWKLNGIPAPYVSPGWLVGGGEAAG